MSKSWLAKLKKLWNARLAESAFVDIESPSRRLKQFEAEKFVSMSAEYFQATADYYARAYKHAHNHSFSSNIEKNIWLLHANGKGTRSIATQLRITPHQAAVVVEKHRKLLRAEVPNKVLQFTSTKKV